MINLKEIEFTPADSEQVEETRKAIARHLNRRNQKDKEHANLISSKSRATTSTTDTPYTADKGNGSD